MEKIMFSEKVFTDILPHIGAPLHERCLRDREVGIKAGEADLSPGFRLIVDDCLATGMGPSLEDFESFLSVAMELTRREDGYAFRLVLGEPQGCPVSASEAFHLDIGKQECRITCRDAEGARRALVRIEDEMLLRRSPYLPVGSSSRWVVIKERISRSPVAPCRWMTGWELEDEREYYPDGYLNRLAHCGINGIWVDGLLRRMVASKVLPELGPPEHRLEILQRL
ncbi:MAG: hypothetical protein Q8O57_10550, partial [Kiritimatiellota bacterium]|nr:hypothetical protein [Kiritimatiellota bacterium]